MRCLECYKRFDFEEMWNSLGDIRCPFCGSRSVENEENNSGRRDDIADDMRDSYRQR